MSTHAYDPLRRCTIYLYMYYCLCLHVLIFASVLELLFPYFVFLYVLHVLI